MPSSRHVRFAGTKPTWTWAHWPRRSSSPRQAVGLGAVGAEGSESIRDPRGIRRDQGDEVPPGHASMRLTEYQRQLADESARRSLLGPPQRMGS
jgi:hypothetical protein